MIISTLFEIDAGNRSPLDTCTELVERAMYLCALNPPREFQAKAHVLNTTVEIKVYHYAAGPRWGAHNVAYLIGMRNLPAIERHNICDYAATLADTLFELAEPTPLSRGNDLWESPPLLRSKL